MSTTSVAGNLRLLTSHEGRSNGHQKDSPQNQESC